MAPDLATLAALQGGHSIFAPSGAAMWTACSGSLIPNLLAGDQSSEPAAEGTVAHGLAEEWLKTGVKPLHRVGTFVTVTETDATYLIEITLAMLDYVEQYVTWCWQLEGDHFVETRVDVSDLTPIPNQGGTADHAACEPGVLTITDLKFGKGVQVFATNNPQLQIYAYGVFKLYDWFYDFQRIVIRICQPRLGHFDTWEISRTELLAFADWVRERATLAWDVTAPRTPGAKQCQWCKVRPNCLPLTMLVCRPDKYALSGDVTFNDTIMDAFIREISDELGGGIQLTLPDRATLTFEQKCELLRYKRMAEKFWQDLESDVEAELFRGTPSTIWKLVEGRSARVIVDPELAAQELDFLGLAENEIFKRDLRSFEDLENALRKQGFARKELPGLFDSFVRKPPGRPTLVPMDDPRPTFVQDDDVFDD